MSRFGGSRTIVALIAFSLVLAGSGRAQATWYVDDDAPGDPGPGDPTVSDPDEDGSADRPFDAIQEGLDAARNGEAVLVLDGTYTGDGNRNLDYGGRVITVRSASGPENCIIDCQSARGFFFHSGEPASAILRGFTVTNGSAGDGAGIFIGDSGPTVIDCVLVDNAAELGGGMYNENSNPTIVNCTFVGNSGFFGGGMFNQESSPTVIGCTFVGNEAEEGDSSTPGMGGAMLNDRSDAAVINCTFSGNTAYGDEYGGSGGGGMQNLESNPTVVNCTFSGNSAFAGGGIHNQVSSPTVSNCIFWGDSPNEIVDASASSSRVEYSNVQNGTGQSWFGVGCIDADPLFVDPNHGDYHLSFGSPCVDAGANTAVPTDNADFDADGETEERTPLDSDFIRRFTDRPATVDTGVPAPPDYPQVVDMGAYEFGIFGDLDGDCEVGLSDLARLLASYGAATGVGYDEGSLDLDGDVDLSDLAALLAVYGSGCP